LFKVFDKEISNLSPKKIKAGSNYAPAFFFKNYPRMVWDERLLFYTIKFSTTLTFT
jgi:hypothetical protein